MSAVLFWDIDGTLLTTARAGVFALEAAARELCGAELDLSGLATAGLTDAQVAELALESAGCEMRVMEFLACYERRLPGCLHRRRGGVLPGVTEILDRLEQRPDVVSLLLTGNTPAGARAKLAHYGLAGYFPDGGAFCEQVEGRTAIAERARTLAAGREPVFVIGDTVHDVAAGRTIGARTVAVASGPVAADALEAAGPWLLLERLPAPDRFLALLGIA